MQGLSQLRDGFRGWPCGRRSARMCSAPWTGSDQGSGLGLSIVAAIAEMHGGRLELHALAGGGFQVVIELPLALQADAGASA